MYKMKNQHLIIIKNPRLRKIRENLRCAIIEGVLEQINRLDLLGEIVTDIEQQDTPYSNSFESLHLKSSFFPIFSKRNELSKALTDSICQCGMGPNCVHAEIPAKRHRRTDLDMGFIPETNQWYCIDCYRKVLTQVSATQSLISKGICPRCNVPLRKDGHRGFKCSACGECYGKVSNFR